jgi:hypothetical protein
VRIAGDVVVEVADRLGGGIGLSGAVIRLAGSGGAPTVIVMFATRSAGPAGVFLRWPAAVCARRADR